MSFFSRASVFGGILRRSFATAQAIRYTQHGVPSQVLKKETINFDEPKGNGVQVKILCAPINPADLNMVEGNYALLPPLPAVGGNEGVGVVEQTGPDVKGLAAGDLVIAGAAGLGTWRTQGVFPADKLIKVPKDIKPEYAASIGVNACTAYRLLTDFVKLNKGDVVLANGGSSSVVSALAALCKVRGYNLVVEMRDRADWEDMVSRLKEQGATAVVNDSMTRTPAFKQLLSDMPPVRLALNCVGGKSATELARHLSHGGTLVTYGGMSRQPLTIPTSLLIFKDIVLRGFWMTRWNEHASQKQKSEMLDELFSLIRSNQLKMFVERHEFAQFEEALKRAQESNRGRKVILVMNK